MGRGPNSGGGKFNKDAKKGPARARFSKFAERMAQKKTRGRGRGRGGGGRGRGRSRDDRSSDDGNRSTGSRGRGRGRGNSHSGRAPPPAHLMESARSHLDDDDVVFQSGANPAPNRLEEGRVLDVKLSEENQRVVHDLLRELTGEEGIIASHHKDVGLEGIGAIDDKEDDEENEISGEEEEEEGKEDEDDEDDGLENDENTVNNGGDLMSSSEDEDEDGEEKLPRGVSRALLHHLTHHFRFKREYAIAALAATAGDDLGGALDWLCLHLKEDEIEESLPETAAARRKRLRAEQKARDDAKRQIHAKVAREHLLKPKSDKGRGVSSAVRVKLLGTTDWVLESMIVRLNALGFSRAEAKAAIHASHRGERAATMFLTRGLQLAVARKDGLDTSLGSGLGVGDVRLAMDARRDELEAMRAVLAPEAVQVLAWKREAADAKWEAVEGQTEVDEIFVRSGLEGEEARRDQVAVLRVRVDETADEAKSGTWIEVGVMGLCFGVGRYKSDAEDPELPEEVLTATNVRYPLEPPLVAIRDPALLARESRAAIKATIRESLRLVQDVPGEGQAYALLLWAREGSMNAAVAAHREKRAQDSSAKKSDAEAKKSHEYYAPSAQESRARRIADRREQARREAEQWEREEEERKRRGRELRKAIDAEETGAPKTKATGTPKKSTPQPQPPSTTSTSTTAPSKSNPPSEPKPSKLLSRLASAELEEDGWICGHCEEKVEWGQEFDRRGELEKGTLTFRCVHCAEECRVPALDPSSGDVVRGKALRRRLMGRVASRPSDRGDRMPNFDEMRRAMEMRHKTDDEDGDDFGGYDDDDDYGGDDEEEGDEEVADIAAASRAAAEATAPGDLHSKFASNPLLADIARAVDDQAASWPWLFEQQAAVAPTDEEGGVSDAPLDPREALRRQMKPIDPEIPAEHASRIRRESEALLAEHRTRSAKREYRDMLDRRKLLPAYQLRDTIVELVRSNRVVVVSGETGCGKTTQLPQIILDDLVERGDGALANLICTQPRRISAVGVADRVAAERAESLGHTVGYQIRLESKRSKNTRLLFCTTGVLLRRMQCDGVLRGVSHIFVDEIHERSLDSDFLLIILRRLLARRPGLRVILMSATLNAKLFSDYFGGCPILEIEGRAHPVRPFFLEDAIEHSKYICPPNSDFARADLGGGGGKKGAGGGGGFSGGGRGGRGGFSGGGRGRGGGRGGFSGGGRGRGRDEGAKKGAKGSIMGASGGAPAEELHRLRKAYPGRSDETLHTIWTMEEECVNHDLIESVLRYVSTVAPAGDGAVLVFLPGLADITEMHARLSACGGRGNFGDPKAFRIFALHSSLSTDEQRAIFERPPLGCRKIVLATNIAETSITIDDCVYVIDAGRVKENQYDPLNRMASLVETFVSKASATQRRGRAGRVKPGICYHLISGERWKTLPGFTTPEMLRVPLDETVLSIRALDLGDTRQFLAEAVDPPDSDAVDASLATLRGLRALDARRHDRLTPLGYHLSALPVDPRLGKMLLLAAVFRCLDPVLTIAAALSTRPPFVSPIDKRQEADEAKARFAVEPSDHVASLFAFRLWREAAAKGRSEEQRFLRANFLSRQGLTTMADLRDQFFELLSGIGFVLARPRRRPGGGGGNKFRSALRDAGGGDESAVWNAHASNLELVKGVITAGLYPNVAQVIPGGAEPKLVTPGGTVALHPASVLANKKRLGADFLIFHEKVKTSQVYLRDATAVGAWPLLLFGGRLEVFHARKLVVVDEWLPFRAPPKVAVLARHLRHQLEVLLRRRIEDPTGRGDGPHGVLLVDGVANLLASEGGGGIVMEKDGTFRARRAGEDILPSLAPPPTNPPPTNPPPPPTSTSSSSSRPPSSRPSEPPNPPKHHHTKTSISTTSSTTTRPPLPPPPLPQTPPSVFPTLGDPTPQIPSHQSIPQPDSSASIPIQPARSRQRRNRRKK